MLYNDKGSDKVWAIYGNGFIPQTLVSGNTIKRKLDPGVYEIKLSPKEELYLDTVSEKFMFDYKIYGLRSDFINKFIKTYESTSGNIGALFNGLKGTGKTVLAKVLANKLNLPVILVTKSFEGAVINFIARSFEQEIVVLIDEYEKVFEYKQQEMLLTLMDGVLDNNYRKVFLLTTNSLNINENLIDRPSRIKYLLEFSDLTEDEIIEVVDDSLSEDCIQFKQELIDLVKTLKIITIDNIKQIVNEINIHKQSPNILIKDMNISRSHVRYNISMVDGNNLKVVKRNFNDYDDTHIGVGTYIYGVGRVSKVLSNNKILINIINDTHRILNNSDYKKFEKLYEKKDIKIDDRSTDIEIYSILGEEDSHKYVLREFIIEKCEYTHKSFNGGEVIEL